MGKKWKIGAWIAGIVGAIAGALFFSKKENRDKAKKKYQQAKSKTISATNKAKSTAQKAKQRIEQELSLEDVKGLGKVRVKRLRKNGIVSLAQLRKASLKRISEAAGVSEDQARKIQNSAKGMK